MSGRYGGLFLAYFHAIFSSNVRYDFAMITKILHHEKKMNVTRMMVKTGLVHPFDASEL
jgi:hypothetical protein